MVFGRPLGLLANLLRFAQEASFPEIQIHVQHMCVCVCILGASARCLFVAESCLTVVLGVRCRKLGNAAAV